MKIETLPKYVIIMKIGPFSGFSLEEIIDIKKKEQKEVGKFFLGYSGVFCHPKRVKEFIDLANNDKEKVFVLFIKTSSNFLSKIERLFEYSIDNNKWEKLHEKVLLVGSKFSIVAKNLKEVDFKINLSHYTSVLGKTEGKTLDKYLRWRCDKSCAVYKPSDYNSSKIVNISYMCELTKDGVVYVR